MASSASDRAGARSRTRLAFGGGLVAALALAGVPLRAQPARQPAETVAPEVADSEPADPPVGTLPDGTRRVAGRVVMPRDSALGGVAGLWVTLHRVGRDAAGPVDSVRSGPDGAFAIRYRPTGAADAVYFVAASRGGVAYFGAPLRAADVRGEAAEITVFDTTSRPVPLAIRGRHLIVAAPDASGAREVLEVFELSNDSSVTAVPPPGSARGVWSTPLPSGVTAVRVRDDGDVPPDGVAVANGSAALMVPVAPGLKQVAFSYRLPADALPLKIPVTRPTGLFEVLVEEGGALVDGGKLAAVAPVALEGKSFRRFLAQESPAGGTVTISAGAVAARPAARVGVPALLAVVGGGMAAALIVAGRRRPRAGAGPVLVPTPSTVASGPARAAYAQRDQLLAELAALDDAHAASVDRAEHRAEYEARRAELKARLADTFAGVGAPS